MKIDFLNLGKVNKQYRPEIDNAVKEVLDSGWYLMGEKTAQFEKDFAEYCGVKHCIGVGNGLEALKLILQAYEISKGDDVIIPSNTFIATSLAVSGNGATPILVEPNEDDFLINASLIEEAITPRTKAIMPVHLYGKVCDMDEINRIAKKHGLKVIEDSAQAHGATYKGKKTGSLGECLRILILPRKKLRCNGRCGSYNN